MTQFANLFRLVTVFSIAFAVPVLTSAEVMGDCGPPAAAENPLHRQALEAKERLEASNAAANRKRQFADRWTSIQSRHLELEAEAVRDDEECRNLKAAADATLAQVQSCQALCNQAGTSQSAYQACLACAGPVNAELAQREAEYVSFSAKVEPYNNRVRDWEEHLKKFTADAEAATPKVIQKEVDRMVSILTDSPALFVVADSSAQANPTPKHYLEYFEQVTKHADRINEAAARHNADPDLVRAIIWMESTRGYYDGVTGLVLKPKTILPMNVYADYWTGFRVTREGLQNPAINIDTGTKILARLQARTSDNSIAKTATLYGDLAAQKESEYGKTVEYYYNTKPWLNRTNN